MARNRAESPYESELFVAVLRAADALSRQAEQLLKTRGLTAPQYNVLRILRGAHPEGLACSSIGERMISRDPDMTRLLDRIEKLGLLTRERESEDRRVVRTRITEKGLALLKTLDAPVHELHKLQFQKLPSGNRRLLAELLADVYRANL
jgi:DNA-binding MarR family transcriptional regulator